MPFVTRETIAELQKDFVGGLEFVDRLVRHQTQNQNIYSIGEREIFKLQPEKAVKSPGYEELSSDQVKG